MESQEMLDEMAQLRQECRFLNAEILTIENKTRRRTKSLETLLEVNKSLTSDDNQLKEMLNEYEPCDVEELKAQINQIELEIENCQLEYETLCKDVNRLDNAIEVQNDSKVKQEIYGSIRCGYTKTITKKINKEGCAIALKRSLEEELQKLERANVPTRIIAKKRSQLSRAVILCP